MNHPPAPKQILVIDDELDIRTVVKACLTLVGGFVVSLASSGQEGVLKATTEQPDAILLDVMLPDMDGLTTFAKLRTEPTTRQIPVILLTAKVRPGDHRHFADLGITAVIEKPFDPVTLSSQIAHLLGWEG
jgi:CheY-like chemotaxis protein